MIYIFLLLLTSCAQLQDHGNYNVFPETIISASGSLKVPLIINAGTIQEYDLSYFSSITLPVFLKSDTSVPVISVVTILIDDVQVLYVAEPGSQTYYLQTPTLTYNLNPNSLMTVYTNVSGYGLYGWFQIFKEVDIYTIGPAGPSIWD